MGVANTAVHGAYTFVVVVQNIVFTQNIHVFTVIVVNSHPFRLHLYSDVAEVQKNGNIKLKKQLIAFSERCVCSYKGHPY